MLIGACDPMLCPIHAATGTLDLMLRSTTPTYTGFKVVTRSLAHSLAPSLPRTSPRSLNCSSSLTHSSRIHALPPSRPPALSRSLTHPKVGWSAMGIPIKPQYGHGDGSFKASFQLKDQPGWQLVQVPMRYDGFNIILPRVSPDPCRPAFRSLRLPVSPSSCLSPPHPTCTVRRIPATL